MSGQWPKYELEPGEEFQASDALNSPQGKLPTRPAKLTTKQVRNAHDRIAEKRFPTTVQYLEEFTKELNLELQKQT